MGTPKKVGILLLEVFVFALLLRSGSIYFSHFQFPDNIVSSLYSAAEQTLLDAANHACKINYADGYAGQDDSYVFEAVLTDTGKTLSERMIIKNTVSITLYTTYDYSKISEYQSGQLSLDQMKAVQLDRIVVTNVWGSYFVGDKILKSDLRVVAYYTDNSERELEVEEYEISTDTVLNKSGDNIITVSYTENEITETYDLTVVAEEAVLTNISATYTGEDLMEGTAINPSDFTVIASYSDGRDYEINEGQYSYDPTAVVAGSNTVTITYGGKETTCVITAYGEGEIRPIGEAETNDTFGSANIITIPCDIEGEISDLSDIDIYQITLSESGRLDIGITSEMEYTAIYVYTSSSSDIIWYSDNNRYDSSVGIWKKTFSLDLSKDTYFIKITGQQYADSESTSGLYGMAIDFESASCIESGGHTSLDSAYGITLYCDIKDQISLTERNRFYSFEVTESSKITFIVTSYMNCISWWLYPETETDSFYSIVNIEKTESLEKAINTYTIYLHPGVYFLRISGREGSTDAADTGNFLLSFSSETCVITSSDMITDTTLSGIVASNETSEQYNLTIPYNGYINIAFDTNESAKIEILTINGNHVWDGTADTDNHYFEGISLAAGNYYVVIYKQSSGGIAFGMSYEFVENVE
ncbi:MAG: bacterial Ig-like domain-containing protein [Clostridiales bacterium]|nr:bacterial Ig-like domain-containing protein [Clostridiales bacterium]